MPLVAQQGDPDPPAQAWRMLLRAAVLAGACAVIFAFDALASPDATHASEEPGIVSELLATPAEVVAPLVPATAVPEPSAATPVLVAVAAPAAPIGQKFTDAVAPVVADLQPVLAPVLGAGGPILRPVPGPALVLLGPVTGPVVGPLSVSGVADGLLPVAAPPATRTGGSSPWPHVHVGTDESGISLRRAAPPARGGLAGTTAAGGKSPNPVPAVVRWGGWDLALPQTVAVATATASPPGRSPAPGTRPG